MARRAPRPVGGVGRWWRERFFAGPFSAVFTIGLLVMLTVLVPKLWSWAVTHAVTAPDLAACQAARGKGACWGVVAEKYRLILFGRYPFEAQWRPAAATGLLLMLVVASGVRSLWTRWLGLAWGVGLVAFFALMAGGVAGLERVSTDQWGGLPLTVMLATFSIALACPLAVALALGRRSGLPAIRALCTVFIELVRGVPLISVLFMASFLFPLLLPAGTTPDVLLRVVIGLTLFAAAYVAEVVRAGLQAVPLGQSEAAASIGLGWWDTQRLVVLPQALSAVVPGLMNNFISIFKDTSLVTIVSLYELTGSLGLALNGDPQWRPFKVEAYLFLTAIYFVFCASLSRYSLWVETRLARTQAR